MPNAAKADKDQKKPGLIEEAVEIVKTVVYALGIALFIRVLFFQPYTIPSASMEPNLYRGDYIIVTKWSYGYSRHSIIFSPPIFHGRLFFTPPKRGDIIVFKLPRDGHQDYVKRLIGLPGDRIQMKSGILNINGKPVGEHLLGMHTATDHGAPEQVAWVEETNPEGRKYVIQDHGRGYAADDTDVYVVPQHCYFMMGDNRDNSADSRFDPGLAPTDPKLGGCGWDAKHDAVLNDIGVGFVPEENLVGKAQFIMLSWDDKATIFKPWTWFMDARPSRFFRVLEIVDRRAAAAAELERRLGHAFTDRTLLDAALTHASVSDGARKDVRHNERLEFLGDRVLGLLAAEALVRTDPTWREGELPRRKNAVVTGKPWAAVARGIGLPTALRLAGSTPSPGGRNNDRILGDAMEALMAAVYLDAGLAAARAAFDLAWAEALTAALTEQGREAKTALQEWAMAQARGRCRTTVWSRGSGPTTPLCLPSRSASRAIPRPRARARPCATPKRPPPRRS